MSDTATTPARSSGSSGDQGLVAWLKTREGKIVAGGGAAVLVVLLALRRAQSAGEDDDDTFAASELQASADGTLQDRLDQVGGRGGTLDDWITATGDLSGDVGRLADILSEQDEIGGGDDFLGVEGLQESEVREHPGVPLDTWREIKDRPEDLERLTPEAARAFREFDLRNELRSLRRRR